ESWMGTFGLRGRRGNYLERNPPVEFAIQRRGFRPERLPAADAHGSQIAGRRTLGNEPGQDALRALLAELEVALWIAAAVGVARDDDFKSTAEGAGGDVHFAHGVDHVFQGDFLIGIAA